MTRIHINACYFLCILWKKSPNANKLNCKLHTKHNHLYCQDCICILISPKPPPTLPEKSIITGSLCKKWQKRNLFREHYIHFMLSINLLLHTFPFLFVFVLPDVLFKMTRFFIGSMAIKTFVWSVSIIHKIIVKIILEELAILWDWLEKTCTQTQTHKGKTNWQSYFKAAVV